MGFIMINKHIYSIFVHPQRFVWAHTLHNTNSKCTIAGSIPTNVRSHVRCATNVMPSAPRWTFTFVQRTTMVYAFRAHNAPKRTTRLNIWRCMWPESTQAISTFSSVRLASIGSLTLVCWANIRRLTIRYWTIEKILVGKRLVNVEFNYT